jgi:phage shock protein PspC (stress-responsive transcriptional regulator)
MNEVTQIHLGRQAYTISVDAHKELRAYLADIESNVGDKEVVNEIELRMSELLAERGVTGEKVILPADVDYLKQQLGEPADFSEKEDAAAEPKAEDKVSRRLFRDTDNAIVAGVAAGVGNYFGLDAVIIRILFVLLTIFSGGIGLVLYILLWLVVPPAETASEKLQMRGKSVTIESLKDSVDKADLPGAVRRVNNKLPALINGILRVCLKLIGLGFIVAGLGVLAFTAFTRIYMSLHNGQLFQENLFPVGAREQWLLAIAMGLAVIAAVFLLLMGIAAFKHKWPIRSWLTGVLAGLFLVGSVAGLALTADVAPRVRDRYETSLHTTAVQGIQPFSKVVTTGDIDIAYISSPNYSVNVHYVDHPDLSKLKIQVRDGTLYIDSTALDGIDHCTMLCLFPRYDMTVQIYAPNVENFQTPKHTDIFYPAPPVLN